jgi:hypothetical protein
MVPRIQTILYKTGSCTGIKVEVYECADMTISHILASVTEIFGDSTVFKLPHIPSVSTASLAAELARWS